MDEDLRDEAVDRLGTSRADRARSLDALHDVEARANTAAPGREAPWVAEFAAALSTLDAALGGQQGSYAADEGALAELERIEPRLRNRVAQLRERFRNLVDDARKLRETAQAASADTVDVADLRRRLEQVAAELRYLQAREADLFYEAYAVDLGAGD